VYRKIFLILFVLLLTFPLPDSNFLIPNVLHAQGSDTLWTRTYGGAASDEARCVMECQDSGYAIAGSTASWGNGGSDMYLIRINPNGDTLWTKTYGGSEDDQGYALAQTLDSGLVIAGSTRSSGAGGSDVFLVKTDATGNALWQRVYGGVLDEQAFDVMELADHGYIVAGSTRSFGAGYLDVYVVRTDSAGDTVWTRTFGGTDNDYARSLTENAAGEFLVLGTTNSFGAGQGDLYLVRINAQGESLCTRAYGGLADNRGYCIQSTSDGGYIISGTSFFSLLDYEFLLVKLDSLYNEEWIQCNGSLNADCAYAVRSVRTGGYVYAGNFSFEMYLARTDTMGLNYWAQFYGGDYTDCAYSIEVTSDGGYIIAGVTNSFGAGENDAYVIKIGPDPTNVAEAKEREIGSLALSVYPNPFRTRIDIRYRIHVTGSSNHAGQGHDPAQRGFSLARLRKPEGLPCLKIFDATGRLVKQFNRLSAKQFGGIQPFNRITWSGTDEVGRKVPAGVYFIQLETEFLRETKKVTVLK